MGSKKRGRPADEAGGILHWVAGVAGVALLMSAAWWWSHAKSFPEVTSPESLHLMRALYTACSSQNEGRLQAVEQQLANIRAAGKLSTDEEAAFESIMSRAKAADWEQATDASYQFAHDQVR